MTKKWGVGSSSSSSSFGGSSSGSSGGSSGGSFGGSSSGGSNGGSSGGSSFPSVYGPYFRMEYGEGAGGPVEYPAGGDDRFTSGVMGFGGSGGFSGGVGVVIGDATYGYDMEGYGGSGGFSGEGFGGGTGFSGRTYTHFRYDICKCQRKCPKDKIYIGQCKLCGRCKLVICCRFWGPKNGGPLNG